MLWSSSLVQFPELMRYSVNKQELLWLQWCLCIFLSICSASACISCFSHDTAQEVPDTLSASRWNPYPTKSFPYRHRRKMRDRAKASVTRTALVNEWLEEAQSKLLKCVQGPSSVLECSSMPRLIWSARWLSCLHCDENSNGGIVNSLL